MSNVAQFWAIVLFSYCTIAVGRVNFWCLLSPGVLSWLYCFQERLLHHAAPGTVSYTQDRGAGHFDGLQCTGECTQGRNCAEDMEVILAVWWSTSRLDTSVPSLASPASHRATVNIQTFLFNYCCLIITGWCNVIDVDYNYQFSPFPISHTWYTAYIFIPLSPFPTSHTWCMISLTWYHFHYSPSSHTWCTAYLTQPFYLFKLANCQPCWL